MVVGPLDSVLEFSSVNEDVLALVHHPRNVGLGVAVKLNDGSVESLHSLLSVEAVFNIVDVSAELFNVGFVGSGFPVILADLFSVVSDLLGIVLDFFLGPFNSLNELLKDDSGSFDCDDLVRVDVDLVGVALVIDGWLVDVPVIDSISKALWGDWASVSIVVVWTILRFDVRVLDLICRGNAEDSSESSFHEVIKV